MAEFNAHELQNFKPSFLEMNTSNMELLNNLSALDHNLNSNVEGLAGFSNQCFLDHHQPQFPMTCADVNVQGGSFHPGGPFYYQVDNFLPTNGDASRESNNIKGKSLAYGEDGSSGLVGDHIKNKRNYNFGGKKRKRSNEREVEKPREVIHVRARRGQATDSHSLAERLRREKINEKLRCLQDLVPGCYKTMGMAVMLDVIISYVRSLQNQIEFLSMKLSAASLFYDFNSSEMEAMEAMQGTNGYEAQQVMERMVGDQGHGGGCSNYFQSTWPL